ncbi:MAG: hypothetical protein ABI142_04565, partial [Bryocella sp.]
FHQQSVILSIAKDLLLAFAFVFAVAFLSVILAGELLLALVVVVVVAAAPLSVIPQRSEGTCILSTSPQICTCNTTSREPAASPNKKATCRKGRPLHIQKTGGA